MSLQPSQTTLARPVSETGIGLHTGAKSALTLLPAAADTGLVFVCAGGVEIPATAEYVVDTRRGTTLGRDESRLSTVEHVLSALYGMGLDNVRIEIEGPEVPALDGSARPWVDLLRRTGKRRLVAPRRELALREAVWAGEGDCWAVATPGRELSLAAGIDFGDAVVGRQSLWLPVTPARYARDLAPARTFAFASEVEALRAAGLAQGGSLENTLVVGPDGYLNAPRFPDEAVRHKTMDAVGDLALCGFRLRAQVTLVRPGHKVCVALALRLRAMARG